MLKKTGTIALFVFVFAGQAQSQLFENERPFTHADTLRGKLTPQRSCYDVTYYHLDISIDTLKQSISGSNTILFKATGNFSEMQFDLFQNMKVDKIVFENKPVLNYRREEGAIFITMPRKIAKDEKTGIKIIYSGSPIIGKNLPWDGGFKWTKDDDGNQWVAVACQGTGASLWWPCKEHQSDEPDSMMISVAVPKGYMDVSNGRLRSVIDTSKTQTVYNWFVSYPINNYNVTINVGKFKQFNDVYVNEIKETLMLSYFVMPYNLEKAKKQFEQVKPMLHCFEKYFGNYPFYRDGYKLVETPYLGMEHQSAIAYGNEYKTGYAGYDFSGIGQTWDYIIIHETAHEWWGNNITTKDIADMWVHEGFGTYAEALYVECMDNYITSVKYLNAQKKKIGNDKPVIGMYDVNSEGSGDMYSKGALMLNTIRSVINNDDSWFAIIKGLQKKFAYQCVTSADVESYISKESGIDLKNVFNQYLRYKHIPVFEYEIVSDEPFIIKYRWKADVENFDMPVKVSTSVGQMEFVYPKTEWQTKEFANITRQNFRVADNLFYIKTEEKK